MIENGKRELDPVDVAIVGAGMAGLSTAVYSRRAGFSARVFERHSVSGGLCTAWKRKGYVFDYCVHWLLGSGPGHSAWKMWKELGAIEGREFINHEFFSRYSGRDGRSFDFPIDPELLEKRMRAASPEDGGAASELRSAIEKARKFKSVSMEPTLLSLIKLLFALPALGVMREYGGVSVQAWCSRLKSGLLRDAFLEAWGLPDFPMAAMIMTLAMMAEGLAGYPLGGSLPLARAVENRAKSLGAEVLCGRGVKRVLVEGGKAAGLELDDGTIQRSRYVVAACDARSAFESLLEGKYRDPTYEKRFAERKIFPSLIQVSLGVRIDPAWGIDELPASASYPLDRPIMVDGRPEERIGIHHYAYDPLMAPQGGTVILVRFEGDYDRWKALREDSAAYVSEKDRLLDETVRALEPHFPGIGNRIEASDVSTPLSCERYTGNWRGCMEGWLMTTDAMKDMMAGRRLPRTFAGLENFHLIGQWTEPGGGLPPAASNGREAVMAIMKAEKKRN